MNTIIRATVKATARIVALTAMLPAVLCFRLQALVADRNDALAGWSQLLSLLPGITGVYLRQAFYRCTLKHCADNVCICFGTLLSHASTSLGRSVYIGNHCCVGDVTIEDDVLIASHVSIMNGCHQHSIDRLDIPVREQPGSYVPVTIGCDTWIGERATVAADVGRHCVVGAGSVVLKPVPDYAIVVGVPARIIGDRRDVAGQTAAQKSRKQPEPALAE
jgi:acetyltransferase-like isoleucine patch superfamily enzyme